MTITAAEALVPLLYRYGRCRLEASSENENLWNVWVDLPYLTAGGKVGETLRVICHSLTVGDAKEWAVMADAKAEQLWKALDDLVAAVAREAETLRPKLPDPF